MCSIARRSENIPSGSDVSPVLWRYLVTDIEPTPATTDTDQRVQHTGSAQLAQGSTVSNSSCHQSTMDLIDWV